MVQSWITVLVAILYISILFAVASYGDRVRVRLPGYKETKPNIYALSMAVYCTTWTFFGSVGLASTSGLSFLAIYVGPVLLITVGFPVLRRIVKLSKEERITSVADFLGSRYGKNNKVAAVAAIIAVIGTIPYIALQLKAISASVDTLVTEFSNGFPTGSTPFGDITLFVAATLALFAVLFGTRHTDATEHQHGLMLAIAMESVIKLIAFLCVGIFVTWFMFDGVADLVAQAGESPRIQQIVTNGFDVGNFLILTFLSLIVFLLLPRQFHVAVVENNSDAELRRARWLFPLYLVAINLFVVPIAAAGILRFGIAANADDYVLLLPILEEQRVLGLLVFLGGLSAGTAMVIVASVALAIMISNDLILPLILRSRATFGRADPEDMEGNILNIRRTAIFVVLALAYIYYSVADNSAALASIGLVSFAAIAQLAPAFFIGMFWKEANARGAMLGMLAGFCVWMYCLLLPTVLPETSAFVQNGIFGITALKPENLFGTNMSPIANGVIWSLLINTSVFVWGSKSRKSDPQERLQASLFVSYQSDNERHNMGRSTIRVQHLYETLSRYLGPERTKRSFEVYWASKGPTPPPETIADQDLFRFSEQLLASAIGASSSRLVHTLLVQRHDKSNHSNLELLDEASKAIQFNRDVLQTAFDQLEQGITVFDGDYRLASWNQQFRKILNLPARMGQAGTPIINIAHAIAEANQLASEDLTGEQLAQRLVNQDQSWQLYLPNSDKVLEISTSPMPDGGIVITWHDITEKVRAAEALKDANETLEKRVEERTSELEEAKQFADQANASKTRFLAAAGHDILQPLNAARLYSATLQETIQGGRSTDLADNISKSLASVEEILGSILAISRLDTANPELNISNFPLRRITEQMEIEFEPVAKNSGLDLRFVHSSKWVRSDPALLRRMLQNLISNALKFTRAGKVVVGCRKHGDTVTLEVLDTGIGMNTDEQKIVFSEFTRLKSTSDQAPGLGLGLSIVDRIAKLLQHDVVLESKPGHGSQFKILLQTVEPVLAETAKKASPGKSATGQLTGTRVLCIDNEPAILDGMEALLSQWGCEVSCAKNLPEAMQHLKSVSPDVVMVDYHLDDGTGIEAFMAIEKTIPGYLPGILITADRSEEVQKKARDAGLVILNKPVKPAALRALVSQKRHSSQAAE
ncbi:MAG: PAS domain-containing hybrid sensor histidine kinase/response regulator [Pseudomonadota bacterium]